MNGSSQSQTLPFTMTHLPDFYRKKAERELNESSEKVIEGLQELKSMAREHKVTTDVNFEDDFLLQFLRHRKHDVDRALKQLVKFISTRKSWGFLFAKTDIDTYFRYQSAKFFTVLPHRCPDGCVIVLFEVGKWIPAEMPIEGFKTMVTSLFCQSIRDPMTQVNGYKIIFDFTNATFMHMRHFTPTNMYQFYHLLLDSLPGRHKQLIVVNNSLTAKVAVALFKGFASQKVKSRTFLKPSPEDLLEYFPPSLLPVQYGGVLTDYHMTEWMREANEQQKEFSLGGQRNYY